MCRQHVGLRFSCNLRELWNYKVAPNPTSLFVAFAKNLPPRCKETDERSHMMLVGGRALAGREVHPDSRTRNFPSSAATRTPTSRTSDEQLRRSSRSTSSVTTSSSSPSSSSSPLFFSSTRPPPPPPPLPPSSSAEASGGGGGGGGSSNHTAVSPLHPFASSERTGAATRNTCNRAQPSTVTSLSARDDRCSSPSSDAQPSARSRRSLGLLLTMPLSVEEVRDVQPLTMSSVRSPGW